MRRRSHVRVNLDQNLYSGDARRVNEADTAFGLTDSEGPPWLLSQNERLSHRHDTGAHLVYATNGVKPNTVPENR